MTNLAAVNLILYEHVNGLTVAVGKTWLAGA